MGPDNLYYPSLPYWYDNMPAKIIDGTAVAARIKDEVKLGVEKFKKQYGRAPSLTVIIVGDDPASMSYVAQKEKAAKLVGITQDTTRLPKGTAMDELVWLIDKLNKDDKWDGILVQLPVANMDDEGIIEAISPDKDVDGFHPVNLGRLMAGIDGVQPCTPAGVIELLKSYGIMSAGKHVVIVGRSNIVGKPLANLFLQKGEYGDATVTVCHSKTKDLTSITKQADILVAAVGKPGLIKPNMIKDGVVAIDIGTTRKDDKTKTSGHRLVGDLDFEGVSKKASFITPVPKGVGPMTVAMLMKNTLEAAKRRMGGQGLI